MLRDLATDQQLDGTAIALVIDRVTAARMGINAQQIDETLYDAFGQRQISTLFTQLNQYHLVMEATPSFQKNPAKLKDIYVQSAYGGAVPLSAFTHFETTNTLFPSTIKVSFLASPFPSISPRRFAGSGHGSDRKRAEGAEHARLGAVGFSGHGRLFPGFAGE